MKRITMQDKWGWMQDSATIQYDAMHLLHFNDNEGGYAFLCVLLAALLCNVIEFNISIQYMMKCTEMH